MMTPLAELNTTTLSSLSVMDTMKLLVRITGSLRTHGVKTGVNKDI
jgi:hypothetical protein